MLRSSLLLATASLLATPALGQTAPDSEEIVVTAQRGNRAVVERGGSVGVLGEQPADNVPFQIRSYTEALILDQQPQSLGQVLENDPTVRTSYGFGNAAEQFVIRGFTLFGDDVGMDGLYGITPRQLVAPELYQSVQVLNGASAFLNGAAPGGSGIGGSINLIPKRASIQPLARVTAGYTSSGQVGVGFDVARRWNDGAFGLRLNGAHRRGKVAIDDENRRSTVLGAGLDWRGERVRLSLDLGYQKVRVEQLRPKVTVTTFIPRVPDADANYAQPWTYTDLEDIFGIAKAEVDLSENVLLYGQIGARDGSEYGIYSSITAVAPDGEATGSALFVPRTDNNEAGQAGIRAKAAFAGTTHELNFGASHVRQVNRNAYDFLVPFATDLYDTPEVALPGTGFVGGDLDDPFAISRTRLTSVFASDTIGLAQDRVLITAGLRHQRIRVKGYSYADGSLEREYDEDAVTPVIGVVVKPRDGLSLYANRIEGLQQGPVAPNDPTISNPGEIFAPYKSVQYEAGAKLGLGGLNAGLALFRMSLPSAGSVADEDNPGLFRYGLFGRQRNRGVEFTVDGDVTPSLRVIAGVSLLDATLRRTPSGANDGNRAPGVPTYLANANVEWDVPSLRGLTLTGRAVSTGKQQVDAANSLEIGRWTRFDAGARYVLVAGDRPLTLRAGVDNLFNKRYWSSAFETFGASLLQGQPRTFRLSTSIDL